MAAASIPTDARCSAGVAEPGIVRTAKWLIV
jgi:hypothetical protein